MRVAVVCAEEPELSRARLERARTSGHEVVPVMPPDLAVAIGAEAAGARWAQAPECTRAAPGQLASTSSLAFTALLQAGAPLDEVRFAASGGAGFVACAEARTGGVKVAQRLVVELAGGDGALAHPTRRGETPASRLAREATRLALRDADTVEGNEHARRELLAAGWELARPAAEPAWAEGRGPAVSAVVTCFNLGRFLPECLASLRAQTVPVEIVVVDDGSSAEEATLIDDAVAAVHGRLVRQPNAGVSAARNAGVKAAAGELVLVVDADNVMRPRLVERLSEALRRRPDAAFSLSAFSLFDDETRKTLDAYGPIEGADDVLFLINCRGDACALHRREALLSVGGFRGPSATLEDWDLWLRYAEAGQEGVALPEILFDYRVRNGSLLRTLSAFDHSFNRFELARRHPKLLAANAASVVWLAAAQHRAELQGEVELARAPLLEAQQVNLAALENAQRELDAATLEVERQREAVRAATAMREASEQARASSEQARVSAEQGRESLEQARESSEQARVAAEGARAATEQALRHAEAALAQALGARQAAETLHAQSLASSEAALSHATAALARVELERDSLAAQRGALAAARDVLVAERDALAAERGALAAARDALVAKRDALAAERDALAVERDALAAERDALERRLAETLGLMLAANARADGLASALDEMGRSSAVRAARSVQAFSPLLRRALGRLASALLPGPNQK